MNIKKSIFLLVFTYFSVIFLWNVSSNSTVSSPNAVEMDTALSLRSISVDRPNDDFEDSKRNEPICLSFDESFETLIQSSKQIFITMPAKAAGVSLNLFMRQCVKDYDTDVLNAIINDKDRIQKLLSQSYQLPSIISNHVHSSEALINLAKGTSDDSLIIYLHRKETDRMVSAIRQVANYLCRVDKTNEKFRLADDTCTIEEEGLVEIIRERRSEIGNGAQDILQCETFDSIEENRPNFVVMNYQQVSQLQVALAKKYCPELVDKDPIHRNSGNSKGKMLVKLANTIDNNNEYPSLDEWLEKKRNVIEWSQGSYQKSSCRSKVRDMERHLFNCEKETLALSMVKG